MEKGWIITAIGIVVVIALSVLVNNQFGPCASPKVEITLSQINNVYIQWQEEIRAIELQDKSDVTQAEIDSLLGIFTQAGKINPVQCMFPVFFEMHFGMDAKIDGYELILEKSQLVKNSEYLERRNELNSNINQLFLEADLHMGMFGELIINFEN